MKPLVVGVPCLVERRYYSCSVDVVGNDCGGADHGRAGANERKCLQCTRVNDVFRVGVPFRCECDHRNGADGIEVTAKGLGERANGVIPGSVSKVCLVLGRDGGRYAGVTRCGERG